MQSFKLNLSATDSAVTTFSQTVFSPGAARCMASAGPVAEPPKQLPSSLHGLCSTDMRTVNGRGKPNIPNKH